MDKLRKSHSADPGRYIPTQEVTTQSLSSHIQPPLLIQRFMLNLRQFNKTDNVESNSDAQHFSRFSIDFRVPSDFLGNIGEHLDHSQGEQLHEDMPCDLDAATGERLAGEVGSLEPAASVLEQPGTRSEDERVSLETSGLVSRLSGARDDEVVDASRAPYMDGASKSQTASPVEYGCAV